MSVMLVARSINMEMYLPRLRERMPEASISIWPDADIGKVEYVLAWDPPHGLLRQLPKLKLVSSVGIGVDGLISDPQFPRSVPLSRVVDPRQAQGMAEYVTFAVLFFHRSFDRVMANQSTKTWVRPLPVRTEERRVGIMGLGTIGGRVAGHLASLGFAVRGWSRSKKELAGVTTYAGDEQLPAFLAGIDMLVCLLPLTPQTSGILNARHLSLLPRGSYLISCGRGQHLVVSDLLALLDAGHLNGACIDVFDQEPLPVESPLWSHGKILVTPHIASITPLELAADVFCENIERVVAGKPILHAVDFDRGY